MPYAPRIRSGSSATAILIVGFIAALGIVWLDGLMALPVNAGPGRKADSAAAPSNRLGTEMAYPSEFVALAPPEYFGPDTLFEIINGDADLYLKAGFVRLETRRFTLKPAPQTRLALFIYQMNSHRSAFAVYSVRRSEEAQPSRLTRFAYRYQKGLFLVNGPYYIEILAQEESPRTVAAMNDLATAFISAHDVADEPIPELDFFPPQGLIPGSMALHPANAFGFDGFTELFTARYRLNDQQATAFLRPCPAPGAAARLAADYQAFLAEYDGVAVSGDHLFSDGRLIRLTDTYTLVFVHNNTVAGVQEAGTAELAARLAHALKARLSLEE